MIPGQASTHHEDAHSTDERGNVTHVGEAVPLIRKDSRLRHEQWIWRSTWRDQTAKVVHTDGWRLGSGQID